jgi:hypothetical protein
VSAPLRRTAQRRRVLAPHPCELVASTERRPVQGVAIRAANILTTPAARDLERVV